MSLSWGHILYSSKALKRLNDLCVTYSFSKYMPGPEFRDIVVNKSDKNLSLHGLIL